MNTPYCVNLEVAGPAAMFTRPDTGSTPVSYPIPTYSAAKGMFDAVLRRGNIFVNPIRVEVCRPIRYERFVTNYGGPLRKPDQIKKDNNYQLIATILVDVHYKIFAEVKEKKRYGRRKVNYAEEFEAEFNRRLDKGQSFYTPCLGWKEFLPTYFGPVRQETQTDSSVNEVIPSLLHEMWENKQLKPKFVQDWEIACGVMSYHYRRPGDAE